MNDPGRFSPEPHTIEEYVRAIWHDLKEVKERMLSDRLRIDALERAVRDLQVFASWMFKLLPVIAIIVTIVGLLTR